MQRGRRQFLLSTCALALSATWHPVNAQDIADRTNAWRRRIESLLVQGTLPIIDLQATYVEGKSDVAWIMQKMDELGVAQIAFAPANAPNSQPSLDLHKKFPEYFIPATNSGEFPRWWTDPMAFISGVRKDLESGGYAFMGEHEFRHYPSPEQVKGGRSDRDITVELDGPIGDALFQLSEEFGKAFQIHYEIEDRLLPPLEAVLARHPKARVIWCHLAMIRYPDRTSRYGPEYVRALIERFPGLHFDLAVPPAESIYRPSGARQSTLYANGQIDPKWLAVMEAFPERFLASSDYRPPTERDYPHTILNQRKILDALSERARHLVAYGNAWRLVTGTPWQA